MFNIVRPSRESIQILEGAEMFDISKRAKEVVETLNKMEKFNEIAIEVTPVEGDYWDDYYAIFTVDIVDFDIVSGTEISKDFNEEIFYDELSDYIRSFFVGYEDKITIVTHADGDIEIFPYVEPN